MREKLIDIVEYYADFLDWDTKEDMVDSIMDFLATDNNVGDKISPTADKLSSVDYSLSATGWIPVSERLPDIDLPCLCYKKRKGHSCYQLGTYLGASFSENCAAFKSMSHYGCIGATHWMPLPQPPKEGE